MEAPTPNEQTPPPADGNASERAELAKSHRAWLHAFAVALVIMIYILVCLGGTVTSKNAGLAIADAPTTHGHNLFLAPFDQWSVGGGKWEHSHRLVGSVVGMLSIILFAAFWLVEKRRPWLIYLGSALLAMIVIQGLMGGFRVSAMSTSLAIIHGIFGQIVFCAAIVVAAATGRHWRNQAAEGAMLDAASAADPSIKTPLPPAIIKARRAGVALLLILLVQLTLGSATRHTGATMAIPDFPANYGGVFPPMSQPALDQAVAAMAPDSPVVLMQPTVRQVHTHFGHRLWAIVVVVAVGWMMYRLGPLVSRKNRLGAPATWLVLLLVVQIAAGALVIWTGRRPSVATLHQSVGALTLGVATWLATRVYLARELADQDEVAGTPATKPAVAEASQRPAAT